MWETQNLHLNLPCFRQRRNWAALQKKMSHQAIESASRLLQEASEILRQLGNSAPINTNASPTRQSGIQRNGSNTIENPVPSSSTSRVPNSTRNLTSSPRPIAPNSSGRSSVPHSSLSNVNRIMSASNRFSPRPSNETRAELSRLFQPYVREPNDGNRNRRRSSGARQLAERTWNQKFFCLVSPTITQSPSNSSKVRMTQAGFGQEIIQLGMSMDSREVDSNIRNKYSKIPEETHFELMTQSGTGARAILIRMSSSEPIPTAAVIHAATRRQSIIYVRPFTSLIEEENDGNDDIEVNNISNEDNLSMDSDNETSEPTVITLSDNENINEMTFDVDNTDENLDGMLTIDDLRRRTYETNPGVQPLFISRENYTMQVIGVYKHPRFNLLMEPDVTFLGTGEFGADAGALMREFFWTGMVSISSGLYMGKILCFEGNVDHKLPSSDAVLLSHHVFEYIGKFIGHSALHAGVGFVGLDQVVVQYMTQDSPSFESLATYLSIEGVSDMEVVEVLELLQEWTGDTIYDPKIVASINIVAQQCELTMSIEKAESTFAFGHILYYNLVTKRKSQLEALRKGFMLSPVYDFVKSRPYLTNALFPTSSEVQVPVDVLLKQIELEGEDENSQQVFDLFMKCLTNILNEDPCQTSSLLKAWTAWPFLTNKKLSLKIEGTVLDIKACFNQITIPNTLIESTMLSYVNIILEGTVGYNSL